MTVQLNKKENIMKKQLLLAACAVIIGTAPASQAGKGIR
jgi:hypothetical protein